MALGPADPQVHWDALTVGYFSIDPFNAFDGFQSLHKVGEVASVRNVDTNGSLKHALASVDMERTNVYLHVARNQLCHLKDQAL